MKKAETKNIDRRSLLKSAALVTAATGAATLPAVAAAGTDPVAIIVRRYLESNSEFGAAETRLRAHESEARQHFPVPVLPDKLMAADAWIFNYDRTGMAHRRQLIPQCVSSNDAAEATRLFDEYNAGCTAANARFGVPGAVAECARLWRIKRDFWDQVVATPATKVEGVVLKLCMKLGLTPDGNDITRSTLADAERLAGLPPSRSLSDGGNS